MLSTTQDTQILDDALAALEVNSIIERRAGQRGPQLYRLLKQRVESMDPFMNGLLHPTSREWLREALSIISEIEGHDTDPEPGCFCHCHNDYCVDCNRPTGAP